MFQTRTTNIHEKFADEAILKSAKAEIGALRH